MKRLGRALLALCGLSLGLLSGCASPGGGAERFLGVITPYRIDIVQGNVVTREQVALVRPGMTRAQVRDILGSPMLNDLFHASRWDYVFMIRRPGSTAQRQSLTAHFEGDVLARLEVAEGRLPTENEFVAAVAPPLGKMNEPALELTDAQRKALPAPKAAPASTDDGRRGPAREYPPLEPR